jgi:hypothetical protein
MFFIGKSLNISRTAELEKPKFTCKLADVVEN